MELWSQNIFSPQNFENIDLLPSDFNVTNEKLGDSLHFSLEGFVIFFFNLWYSEISKRCTSCVAIFIHPARYSKDSSNVRFTILPFEEISYYIFKKFSH